MFNSPFQTKIPADFVPAVPKMFHDTKAWKLVYASGGNILDPTQDKYTYSEFKDTDFPKIEQAAANASLAKEAKYHGFDIGDPMDITELLPKELAGKFVEADNFAEDLGFMPFYYTHRLGILIPNNGVDAQGRPPFGVVVGFEDLPAADRNNRDNSPRTSVRKFESIVNFCLSPNAVLTTMEQKSIWEGFAFEPVFSHNGPTMDKLRQNYEELDEANDSIVVEGGDPIVIG